MVLAFIHTVVFVTEDEGSFSCRSIWHFNWSLKLQSKLLTWASVPKGFFTILGVFVDCGAVSVYVTSPFLPPFLVFHH